MADIVNKETRSKMMASIRSKDTEPELQLRKYLHHLGFRYRLNDRSLPGSPDLVFRGATRAVIFVHGCYWHRHQGCFWCSTPTSNVEFWSTKFKANARRDQEAALLLRKEKWRVGTVWECACRPRFLETTVAEVADWLRSERVEYESQIVRSRN